MAERIEGPPPPVEVASPAVAPLPRARVLEGDVVITRLLRAGAALSGICFAASILLEALPRAESVAYAIEALRRGGVSLLVLTPVMRLVAAGVLLGLQGEWRFAIYAAVIVLLLAGALGAGMSM
ncbi:MAG TPA: hypothetical protein VE782_12500 [Myxococcaceae bacterium]|nr:hypothetical protein [Myxococcaceae bacterium]